MCFCKTLLSRASLLTKSLSADSIHHNLQGSEARDALLAQIFGCGALVRTGRVQGLETVDAVTTMLLGAASRKVFLREVAAEVLLDMLGERGCNPCCVIARFDSSATHRGPSPHRHCSVEHRIVC